MPQAVWEKCVSCLQSELPIQQFNTWIRPLKIDTDNDMKEGVTHLCLLAPNRFVLDWVSNKFLVRIQELVNDICDGPNMEVSLLALSADGLRFQRRALAQSSQPVPITSSPFGQVPAQSAPSNVSAVITPSFSKQKLSKQLEQSLVVKSKTHINEPAGLFNEPPINTRVLEAATIITPSKTRSMDVEGGLRHRSYLNESFTFKSFVEGKSNQLGLAAARQVAENPGGAYNPLFIYGGVGLGKTHLMHAVGNALVEKNPNAKLVYLHSERFVADMVKALQLNAINDFKRYYRSVDALLIDDIQFFAGKDRSQEEFFHTFNALLEGRQQIILTCDRYPKEINGLEERLKSRFGWGLTVAVEPPELETRVAILMTKAEQAGMDLPHDAAFFIARRIRSNVRELEGALKRVVANAHFTGRPIDVELVQESLKDLFALQDKQVGIDNIQRVVAEYYKIKVSDLLSKRRSRSVARPRQVAMSLAKELTNHSLPEIGDAFGGRDHTTVLHACRKIKQLKEENVDIRDDVKNLLRTLTT